MSKLTPHIIDLRQPAKDIVRQVLSTKKPVVLLPAAVLHRAIRLAMETEDRFSYAPNFPQTQSPEDIMSFFGLSETAQWNILEEVGLKSIICNELWVNLKDAWGMAYTLESGEAINLNTTDKAYVGIFSSGSTGRPKCIWNRLEHLKLNASRSARAFSHIHGLTLACCGLNVGVHGRRIKSGIFIRNHSERAAGAMATNPSRVYS